MLPDDPNFTPRKKPQLFDCWQFQNHGSCLHHLLVARRPGVPSWDLSVSRWQNYILLKQHLLSCFFQIFCMSYQFSKTDKYSHKTFGATQSCGRDLFCVFLLLDFKCVNSFFPSFAFSFQAVNALGQQEIAFLSISGDLLEVWLEVSKLSWV